MNIEFRPAKLSDLNSIMTIEQAGFTPDEAATQAAMQARIQAYPDTFIVAVVESHLAGYVVGPAIKARYLADDLFEQAVANPLDAPYQAVLSLAVAMNMRNHGVGAALLQQLATVATAQKRQAITLTCLARLVPFYEANGYVNEGESESTHAGEVWYNLVKPL